MNLSDLSPATHADPLIEIDGRKFFPIKDPSLELSSCAITDRPVSTITIKDDDLFLITDTLGNISEYGCRSEGIEGSMGLFCRDTRFLSLLDLQIEGRSPISFSSTAHKGYAISILCSNPQINDQIKAETIGIYREIVIKGGLFESIQITNYNTHPISITLCLNFGADFLDIFEVRGFGRAKRGTLLQAVPDPEADFPLSPELILAYRGLDDVLMESRIRFNAQLPDEIKDYRAFWQLELESRESKKLGYRIHLYTNNRPSSMVSVPLTLAQAKSEETIEEQEWSEQITQIQTDNKSLNQVIQRAEQDIYLLRQTVDGYKVLAAGVPWFSTVFGRDSIIAASQTLILDPTIARETLTLLAHYQGKVDNEWREEEPGKILHEIRLGEMARCHEIPHTPYYGTVDATPLWLMLYAEYFAWTADHKTLDRLWTHAMAAMEWIDRNCKETGYLSYSRRSAKGLVNQGWKDSENCIVNSQGELAQGSVALAEVQGYVYAAKIRMSELAKLKKLHTLAELWQSQAHELKVRFNQDFWLSTQDYCALALDGNGDPVDSITSNPGHCLNLGILDHDKALSVATRLQAPDMFSGWGIRTLSTLSAAYNPMGYHIGSVWPHDNSLIVMGLRSLGLIDQSLQLAQGLIDMTLSQPYYRPPELFCGYEHDGFSSPVPYPVACSPQAWASGTIFQLLRMMINIVPDALGNQLHIIDPALLGCINSLSIQNLRVGQTLLNLEFERLSHQSGDTTSCRVTQKRGNLRVVIEA